MLKRLPNDTPFQLPETEWELTFSDDFACFDRTKWKCNTMLNPENPARNGIRNNAFSPRDVQWSGEDGLEVDVMESPHAYHLLPRAQNQNIHVLHADGYDERLKTLRSPAFYVPQMYTEFHTYGFLWETDKYAFFVDGHKTWETKHIYQGRDMGICRVPEYLLLSAEVAGCMENGKQYPGLTRNNRTGKLEKFWCGNPDKNDKSKPYDFVIDSVRCYRRWPK